MVHWVRAALVLAVLLFVPGLREDFELPKTAAVRVLGFAALAAGLTSWSELRRLRGSALDVVVGAWLATELLSTAVSAAPLLSLMGEPVQREGLLTSMAMAGLYLGARLSTRSGVLQPGLERTVDAFLVAATLASMYALLQAVHLDPVEWTPASVGGWPTAVGRPFGTLGHPNLLGVVSAAATAGLWARTLTGGRWTWLRLGAGLVCAAATLLTLSRGAWMGVAAGVAVPMALAWLGGARPSIRSLLGAGGVLVALAVILVFAGWGERLAERVGEMFHPTLGSGGARVEMWSSAVAAWVARPVLGWGPDTFALVFPRYQTPGFWRYEWAAMPLHAHSIVLHALVTRGALGLACGVAWCVALLRAARRIWRSAPRLRSWLGVALGMLAAVGVAGLVGAIGVTGHVVVVVISGMMAAVFARDPDGNSRSPDSLTPPARPFAIAAAVLLTGLLSISELESSRQVAAAQTWLARTVDPDPRAARMALDRALAALRAAGRLDPADEFVPRLEVDALLVRAEWTADPRATLLDATVAAQRAIGLADTRVENHVQLARVRSYRVVAGDTASRREAEAELDLSTRLAPTNALILNECARMDMLIGRMSHALEITRRVTSLYPNDGASLLARARAEAGAGDPRAAARTLRIAIDSDWRGDQGLRAAALTLLASLEGLEGRRTP